MKIFWLFMDFITLFTLMFSLAIGLLKKDVVQVCLCVMGLCLLLRAFAAENSK